MRRLLVSLGVLSALLAFVPLNGIAQEATPEAGTAAAPDDASAKTAVHTVLPYDADGLNPDLNVTSNLDGACQIESLASPGRPDAWNCVGDDDQIYDPCFENAFASQDDPVELACFTSPFSNDVVLLSLDQPLTREKEAPHASHDGTLPMVKPRKVTISVRITGAFPGRLELANGDRCVLGTQIDVVLAGEPVHYDCADGGTILGHVNRDQPLWTVVYLDDGALATTMVDVTAAWY